MSKKKKRNQPADEILDDTMDSTFAYIAGYTPGGFPYGTTWEELGIDPGLPLEEKARLYRELPVATDSGLTTQDRTAIRTIAQELNEIHTTLQDMYLSTDQPDLRDAMNGLEEAMISLSGLWVEEEPVEEKALSNEFIEVDDSELPF